MPRHVDLTANVERTSEERLRIVYSLSQIDSVIDGYPALDDRLYVPEGEHIPFRHASILGREVRVFDIPGGHDATGSSYRRETLANPALADDFLFGPPDPDMPTGIGWYTHLWLAKMCDGVTMRLSAAKDDIEVLLYHRRGDRQSEPVWATPGGFVVRSDTMRANMTPLEAASARRTHHWAEARNFEAYKGVPVPVKYPISSGNTLVAGLETTPYARFIHDPDYVDEPPLVPRTTRAAGFISLRAICESNPTAGVSGKEHHTLPFPMWTTHFEYVTAGLDAIADPENQHRFLMRDPQFRDVQAVVEDLQNTYPALLAA